MYTLYNQGNKQVAQGHTIKTLKHQAKRHHHQQQRMVIKDENGTPVMERNSGTWRQL